MTQQALIPSEQGRPPSPAPQTGGAGIALTRAADSLERIESRLALVDARNISGEDYTMLMLGVEGVYLGGEVCRGGPYVKVNPETRALLTRLPTVESEIARAEALRADIEAAPDRRASLALVSQLLDAFPNGQPANRPVYAASIMHDLCAIGLSPVLVARTCQRVRRSARFLPTVAEMIEAAEAVRKEYRAAQERAELTVRRIRALSSAVAAQDAKGRIGE